MAMANRLMASILRKAKSVLDAAEMLVAALPSSKRWEAKVAITEKDSMLLNEVRDSRMLRDLFLHEASTFQCDAKLDIRGKLACFFKHKLDQIKTDHAAQQKRNKNSISLMSMHGVKGLEFDVVFVVQAVDGEMPLTVNDDDDDDGDAECEVKAQVQESWPLPPTECCDVQEERRLFYVAMTRARKRLVLAWMEAVGKTACDMSPFIKEIPPKYLVPIHKHKKNLPKPKIVPSGETSEGAVQNAPQPNATRLATLPDAEAAAFDQVPPLEAQEPAPAEEPAATAVPCKDESHPSNESSPKQQFLSSLSYPCRSAIMRLALKWGQQKAFTEPGRLVTKMRALLGRRLCSASNSAAEQARRPVLREAKDALLHPNALGFAAAILKDIESGAQDDIVLKPSGATKWVSGGSDSKPASEKQMSFLRALGCSEKPSSSRKASELIEKFRKR